ERQSGNNPRDKNTDELFRQTLEIESDAYILHPEYIDLDLLVGFELEEQTLESESSNTTRDDVSFLTEYDLSGVYRKSGPTPFRVYTIRNQTTVDRQFGGSLDNVNTLYGASLDLLLSPHYHHFLIQHSEQEQSAISNLGDFNMTQDLFQANGQLNPKPTEKIDYNYNFEAVDEGGGNRATRQFNRQHGNLIHNLEFGDQLEKNLRSSLFFYDQTGDFDNTRLRLDETLDIDHSDTLSTQYEYGFSTQEQPNFKQDRHGGSARVRHRLFDSLVTTARAGGSLLDRDDGFTSDEVFARLDLDYNKIVPYGILNAQFGLSIQSFENSEQGVPVQILGELHTFDNFNIIRIIRNNIDPSSIVVRDSAMIQTFVEGVDYTVRPFIDFVEIEIIIGGAIPLNSQVAIDYVVGPEPANKSTTDTLSFNVRYDFQEGPLTGLGLFTRYLDVNEDISTDQPNAFTPNSFQDLTVGLDYRFWRVFLETQYLMHDSTILPSDTFSANATYFHQTGPTSRLQLRVNYSNTDFTEDGTETEFLQATGSYSTRLSEQLFANLNLVWQQQDDRDGMHSDAFDQIFQLNWAHRQTQVYFEFRNSIFESDTTDNMSQRIEVGIQRNF
ncbi:MAG: hypothetical protein ACYTGQ_08640, partial [Planctomycetota bacterium]